MNAYVSAYDLKRRRLSSKSAHFIFDGLLISDDYLTSYMSHTTPWSSLSRALHPNVIDRVYVMWQAAKFGLVATVKQNQSAWSKVTPSSLDKVIAYCEETFIDKWSLSTLNSLEQSYCIIVTTNQAQIVNTRLAKVLEGQKCYRQSQSSCTRENKQQIWREIYSSRLESNSNQGMLRLDSIFRRGNKKKCSRGFVVPVCSELIWFGMWIRYCNRLEVVVAC